METSELVWVRSCDVCGCEHQRTERCQTRDLDDLVTKTGTFEKRCERWYEAHVEAVRHERAGVSR